MRRGEGLRLALAGALFLAGCGFDPPVTGDRDSPAFKRSLKACRSSAEKTQAQREGTPGAALRAVFEGHDAERKDVLTCMAARGYPPR